MALGDNLHLLGPRDSAGMAIEAFNATNTVTGVAAGPLQAFLVIPDDVVLLIRKASGLASGVLAVTTAQQTQLRLEGKQSPNLVKNFLFTQQLSAPFADRIFWQENFADVVMVGSLDRLVLSASFSAGNVGNVLTVNVAGLLIPRGNIRQVQGVWTPF